MAVGGVVTLIVFLALTTYPPDPELEVKEFSNRIIDLKDESFQSTISFGPWLILLFVNKIHHKVNLGFKNEDLISTPFSSLFSFFFFSVMHHGALIVNVLNLFGIILKVLYKPNIKLPLQKWIVMPIQVFYYSIEIHKEKKIVVLIKPFFLSKSFEISSRSLVFQ
jgi:hypothetical protein